ncbi:MAG: isochorismatase family protein [Rhodobacteraceae bacterium]|nr:isochorismatase family protein [Paracoccaceae bacterium]
MAFAHRDQAGATRSCPEAERNIATLIEHFRAKNLPIFHIWHNSTEPGSPFRPGTPGNMVQPFSAPVAGETVITKQVNSAFIGTDLEDRLRSAGISRLIITGATANHCTETTTRMAGNLGFDAIYVADGVWAYGQTGPDGVEHSPEAVHSMTIANLDGEFATVMTAEEVVGLIQKHL